jgi:hypothetical protein
MILHILVHGLLFLVVQCDIFTYSVSILIHSPYTYLKCENALVLTWSRSMYYNCSILYLASCAAWFVHHLWSAPVRLYLLLVQLDLFVALCHNALVTTHVCSVMVFISSVDVAGFYLYFEMSYCGGPYFSCWGWRVCFACDRWWLFSLLWLLCLGHMHFDLLYCLSGLCLSCGVSKLNWWNLVFSTSWGVDIFSWIWRLVWFALVQGEYGLLYWETLYFSCYPLEFETWCLPFTLLGLRGGLWFALVWGGVGDLSCILYILLFSYIFVILT